MKFQGIIEGSSVGKSHGFAARVSASFQDVFNGVDYVPEYVWFKCSKSYRSEDNLFFEFVPQLGTDSRRVPQFSMRPMNRRHPFQSACNSFWFSHFSPISEIEGLYDSQARSYGTAAMKIQRNPSFSKIEVRDILHFQNILGEKNVIQDKDELAAANLDWMGKYGGSSELVLRPRNTEEESAGFPSPIPSMADYVAFGKQSRGETSKNTKNGKELADFTSSFLSTPDYVAFEKQSRGENSMNIKAAKVTMNTKTAKEPQDLGNPVRGVEGNGVTFKIYKDSKVSKKLKAAEL